MLVPDAVAAAFFDATGVAPRRIPLTPDYVAPLLKKLNGLCPQTLSGAASRFLVQAIGCTRKLKVLAALER